MPATVFSFSEDNLHMSFKSPFVTNGLNLKMSGVMPKGVYRGFNLAGTGVALQLRLEVDPDAGDSVAVVQDTDGHAITIRSNSDFDVDLSGQAGTTVVVCLVVDYTTSTETTGELRSFELSPADEFSAAPDTVVPLGTVQVPASGTISASNISHTRREHAWENAAKEAVVWPQVIRNPGFEQAERNVAHPEPAPHWFMLQDTDGEWKIVDTESRTGFHSAELEALSASTPISATMIQTLELPIRGDRVLDLSLWYRVLITSTAGSLDVQVVWRTASGSTLTTAVDSLVLSSTNSAIDRQFRTTLTPAPGAVAIASVRLVSFGLEFGSTGPAVRVDDFEMWQEVRPGDRPLNETIGSMEALSLLFNSGGTSSAVSERGRAPKLSVEGTDPRRLILDSADSAEAPPELEPHGRIRSVGERLVDTAADAVQPRYEGVFRNIAGDYTLLHEYLPESGGAARMRLYALPDNGDLIFTVNARWDQSVPQWTKDDSGVRAHRMDVSSANGFIWWGQDAGTTSWADGAWNLRQNAPAGEFEFVDILEVGKNKTSTADAIETAKAIMGMGDPTTETHNLWWEFFTAAGSPSTSLRIYARKSSVLDYDQAILITSNAKWSNSAAAWVADDTSVEASLIVLGPTGISVSTKLSTGTPWASFDDGAAASLALNGGPTGTADARLKDGAVTFTSPGTNTNPAAGTNPGTNKLLAKSLPKAWAYISTDGAGGGSGAVTLDDGFGVASVAFRSPAEIDITFNNAFVNTNYSAIVQLSHPTVNEWATEDDTLRSTTTMTIAAVDGTAAVDIDANARSFSVMVFGEQA